jgi:hypothetical protein
MRRADSCGDDRRAFELRRCFRSAVLQPALDAAPLFNLREPVPAEDRHYGLLRGLVFERHSNVSLRMMR